MTNDPQTDAYAASTESDWADSARLLTDAVVHEPGAGEARPPEDFDGWDEGRQDPKTVEEAAAALAERINDPAAPDHPDTADAYRGL